MQLFKLFKAQGQISYFLIALFFQTAAAASTLREKPARQAEQRGGEEDIKDAQGSGVDLYTEKRKTDRTKVADNRSPIAPRAKRKLVENIQDGEDEDEDDNSFISNQSQSYNKKGQGKKTKKNDDDEIALIGEMSSSISSMAKAVVQNRQHTTHDRMEEGNHELWARLLAMKLQKLSPIEAERFKLKVDGMALELMIP